MSTLYVGTQHPRTHAHTRILVMCTILIAPPATLAQGTTTAIDAHIDLIRRSNELFSDRSIFVQYATAAMDGHANLVHASSF